MIISRKSQKTAFYIQKTVPVSKSMDYVRHGEIQGQWALKNDQRAALYFTMSDIVHRLRPLHCKARDLLQPSLITYLNAELLVSEFEIQTLAFLSTILSNLTKWAGFQFFILLLQLLVVKSASEAKSLFYEAHFFFAEFQIISQSKI